MELTDYELQRLAHIERNREYMRSLGVLAAYSLLPREPAAAPSRRLDAASKRKREPTAPTRRSGRVAGQAAERDGAEIDALGESDEEEEKPTIDRVAEARAVLAHSRAWIEASRAALAKLGEGVTAGGDGDAWRQEAVRRWGSSVVASLPSGCTWEVFGMRRRDVST
jgi:methyl-CpG-binding domain protein 4